MLQNVFDGLFATLTLGPVLAMIFGVAVGMVIGAIPGLSASMGIALAIPFTYGMEPLTALAMLAGIHNGASQGGAIPAILLRIPGTTGSIATAWDGYPMAQKGQAASAVQLAAASSAVGGMISAISLLLLAPALAAAALHFGPPEVFWINVFGLVAVSVLIGSDLLKGIASACIGLLIGTVGLDNVTGHSRFSFGILELTSGIPEIVVIVGLYSLPLALALAYRTSFGGTDALIALGRVTKGVWTVARVWGAWIRASIIGIILGIIPGSSGGSVFIAYTEARRVSKRPEEFGHGSPEGVAAAEAVNNADNAAAMIPTLTLGVPGSNVAALMLGALLIHGLQPGPALFRDNPTIVFGYTWQMFITSLLLIPLGGVVASRLFVQVLRLPPVLLMPMIVAIMVAGTFAYENLMFDVYMMIGFGVAGVVLQKMRFPITPIVIGLVLGATSEYNLRISLLLSHGDPMILFNRPLSIAIMVLILVLVAYTFITQRKKY
ncbi:MAG TPA: tripartite tricarboxylate transporter permease [Devosia sp.]|nr:tripartite tricarboxylate transporter permease [Devosia sp.]